MVTWPAFSQAQIAGGVLVMRYSWAPMFCNGPSDAAIPKDFCGLVQPSRPRFLAHRVGRLFYGSNTGVTGENCPDLTSGYIPTALSGQLQDDLACIDNPYNFGVDDAYHNYTWKASGACVALAAGINMTSYFQLIADTFKKYDADVALKKAGINFNTSGFVDTDGLLNLLQYSFGQKGFVECDTSTPAKYSSYSFCLSPVAPYNITKCPDAYLAKSATCPKLLAVPTANSTSVTQYCYPNYPTFAPPPPPSPAPPPPSPPPSPPLSPPPRPPPPSPSPPPPPPSSPPPPPPSPSPPPAVKTCSYQGTFKIESAGCVGKFMSYNTNANSCKSSSVMLRTTKQSPGPRTHWLFNAAAATNTISTPSSIVAAGRAANCGGSRDVGAVNLAAANLPKLAGSSWKLRITPVNAFTSCNVVTLQGTKGTFSGKYLGVGGNCNSQTNFLWGASPWSAPMQWKLRKVA